MLTKNWISLVGGRYKGDHFYLFVEDTEEVIIVDFMKDVIELVQSNKHTIVKVYTVYGFDVKTQEILMRTAITDINIILARIGVILIDKNYFFKLSLRINRN